MLKLNNHYPSGFLFRAADEDSPVDLQEAPINVDKLDVKRMLAKRIRLHINGASNSQFVSYSKALWVCLLKYNKPTAKHSHSFNTELYVWHPPYIDGFTYRNKEYPDSEQERRIFRIPSYTFPKPSESSEKDFKANCCVIPPFKEDGPIAIEDCVIDISPFLQSKEDLASSLMSETGSGPKARVTPLKDQEVIAFNAGRLQNNANFGIIPSHLLDDIYFLYALQLRYDFLDLGYGDTMFRAMRHLLYSGEYPHLDQSERAAIGGLLWYLHVLEPDEKMNVRIALKAYPEQDDVPSAIAAFRDILACKNGDFQDLFAEYKDSCDIIAKTAWLLCGVFLCITGKLYPWLMEEYVQELKNIYPGYARKLNDMYRFLD